MKNKTLICFILLGIVLSTSLAIASIDVSVENYYPAPVESGNYFNVWLKIINKGDDIVEGGVIRFDPTYPFSLDPGEEQERIISKLDSGTYVTQKFKIRVDKEAKEGENNLAFEYRDCSGCVWSKKSMPITVVEFQTMFDLVLQELSSEGVYIAIANIGKNSANAITVRIPDQEYFETDLTSASIVGNLESGDYTIAAFKILSKQKGINEKKELLVQIDYTDPFGIRRSIVKQILLNPSLLTRLNVQTSTQDTQLGTRRITQGSSFLKNIWFWTSSVLVILLLRNWLRRMYSKLKKLKHKS